MSKSDAAFSAAQIGTLPGILGFDWIEVRAGFARGRFDIGKQHLALNGYLHAATVVALADTACGYGCVMSLPQGASGFTTAELKANFIGTAREGGVICDGRLVHGGRTTQVWDAEVKSEPDDKTIALFRCTQIILYRATAGAPPR
jgi:1,4-dihydroxy-2-naphthoyl-CoA hydrolase